MAEPSGVIIGKDGKAILVEVLTWEEWAAAKDEDE